MAPKNKPNELSLTRVYDAPVRAVWDAWADPKQAAKWWGPRGFTITTHSKDLRPGGHWSYTMHGPDGTDYPNTTIYHEVEKYSRMVYDHGGHADRPPLFRVTVTFSEQKGGKTKMEMTMAFATPEVAQESKRFIKKAGGESTWDRLGEYLDKESTGKERFIINRAFDASIDTLFKMWTDPAHFSRWLPPVGLTMEFIRVDIRPGGESFYKMTDGGEFTMYGRIKHLEVQKPDRIVYSQEFTDEKGNISRHPGVPVWPETMMTVVTLSEEGPDQTRVTVQWEPGAKTAPAELEAFIQMRASMTQGWTGSFDKLEAILA